MDVTPAKAGKWLKPRSPDSYKGQNGKVLVVGGSIDYYGSPALVGLAALRTGADLAYLLVPRSVSSTVAGYAPDLIVWSYPGDYLGKQAVEKFRSAKAKADVLVIGNGITKEKRVLEAAKGLLAEWDGPVVIDADALAIPGLRKEGAVLTPHLREFERLVGKPASSDLAKRAEQVKVLATRMSAVVLLKGRTDIISDGKTTFYNKTGNAGMTHGGTGDTLAGIVGALLSQGHEPLIAGALGAYINGRAGDIASKYWGGSLLASDIIWKIPSVIMELRGKKSRL